MINNNNPNNSNINNNNNKVAMIPCVKIGMIQLG